VLVEWSLNLGEQARQVISGKFSQNDAKKSGDELLVLTDRNLFLVKVVCFIFLMRLILDVLIFSGIGFNFTAEAFRKKPRMCSSISQRCYRSRA
jgi:hypothetical protein